MAEPLDGAALDQLFDKARTNNKWLPREVPDELLAQIVEHMKWAPTSANCSPVRIVFVKSKEAKDRLKPHLSAGNVAKTMAAPATAILAYDLKFYEYLPRLYPPADAKSWFAGKKEHADTTAFRNGTLQGGYFILAARALGLDCGAGLSLTAGPASDLSAGVIDGAGAGAGGGVTTATFESESGFVSAGCPDFASI